MTHMLSSLPISDINLWKHETIKQLQALVGLDIRGVDGESRNIIVLGNPQVGKTTLILTLMGADNDKINELNKILRGGVKKGNSSTSTAIIYTISQTDKFGISVLTDNGTPKADPVFFSTQHFGDELRRIRSLVEAENYSESAIEIFIPAEYFPNRVTSVAFNIIDLPGIGSRNTREKTHVRQLLSVYYDTADVKILVCGAGNVQALEGRLDYLPGSDATQWRNKPRDFIVILTAAYAQGNVCDHFRKVRSERKSSFSEKVSKTYNEQKQRVLGDSSVEIFPIDVGESFQKLLQDKLKTADDKKELLEVQKNAVKTIINALSERRGFSFGTIVDRLRTEIYETAERRILAFDRQKQSYSDEIGIIQSRIGIRKNCITALEKTVADSERSILTYDSVLHELDELVKNSLSKTSWQIDIIPSIDGHFDEGKISNFIHEIKTSIEKLDELERFDQKSTDIFQDFEQLLISTFAEHNEDLRVEFGFWKKLFTSRQHRTDGIQKTVRQIDSKICAVLNERTDGLSESIEEYKRNKISEVFVLKKEIQKFKNLNDFDRQDMAEFKNQVDDCENAIRRINKEKTATIRRLKDYMKVAKEEYRKQYCALVSKINDTSTPASERLSLLLVLGLIERDSESIFRRGDI